MSIVSKCSNCGVAGHISNTCAHPQTSYGVICFKESEPDNTDTFKLDENFNIVTPAKSSKIIIVQRSYTIGYIEFMRGKYDETDIPYMTRLIEMMTIDERRQIARIMNFDKLRDILGISRKNSSYHKIEYAKASSKFDYISKNGTLIKLLETCKTVWELPEWGLPKGRKLSFESELVCGIREFYEETNLKADDIQILMNITPLVETYTGINGTIYRHVYYFAKYIATNQNLYIDLTNLELTCEIRDIKWIAESEIDTYIRDYYLEKKRVLRAAFTALKSLDTNYKLFVI